MIVLTYHNNGERFSYFSILGQAIVLETQAEESNASSDESGMYLLRKLYNVYHFI